MSDFESDDDVDGGHDDDAPDDGFDDVFSDHSDDGFGVPEGHGPPDLDVHEHTRHPLGADVDDLAVPGGPDSWDNNDLSELGDWTYPVDEPEFQGDFAFDQDLSRQLWQPEPLVEPEAVADATLRRLGLEI